MAPKRVGIVGYGHLGKYLTEAVLASEDLSLSFVWNRNEEELRGKVPEELICRDLDDFSRFGPDLVVEVAHPVISEKHGAAFLGRSDYLVGSPTALATPAVEAALRGAASQGRHGLYVPAGALWGGVDIAKMADAGTLEALQVTMKKHPSCFKLESPLREANEGVAGEAVTLFEGPVRALCPLAPNNVNTMAAAAIAAHNLGFDGVTGCLVSDLSLTDWHIVEVDVTGPVVAGNRFSVSTVRRNPAQSGVVTGSATYGSFLSSVKRAGGKGPGVHLC